MFGSFKGIIVATALSLATAVPLASGAAAADAGQN